MKPEDYRKLLESAQVETYKTGDIVFQEGQNDDKGLYLVLSGVARAVKTVNGRNVTLNYMPQGSIFGEYSLVVRCRRTATVIADSDDLKVVSVNRNVFMKQVTQNPRFIRSLMIATVQRIRRMQEDEMYAGSPVGWDIPPELQQAIDRNRRECLKIRDEIHTARQIFLDQGKNLFEEGGPSDQRIYLLMEGELELIKNRSEKDVPSGGWVPGDFFGYVHLVEEKYRKYTARGKAKVSRLIYFDHELFYRIMGANPQLFFSIFKTMVTHLIVYQNNYLKARLPY